jgi:hypothetical protein
MDWTEEEISQLKRDFDLKYEELLVKFPRRTVRALKHQIGKLGLKRSERKEWSDDEKRILVENPNLSAKELAEKLKRSKFQVAHQLRQIRGTANRRFKKGWDIPSKELAYFLGALMSDGFIDKYSFVLTVDIGDVEFYSCVRRIIEEIFGLPVMMKVQNVKYTYKNVVKMKEYHRLWSSSNQFAENFGFSGAKGDWVVHMEKFSWIWDDPWFWSFLGGLYDGDGCLKIRDLGGSKNYPIVEFAIKPNFSRMKVIGEINRRGWKSHEFSQKNEVVGFYINGGRQATVEFLNKIDSVLSRKRLVG